MSIHKPEKVPYGRNPADDICQALNDIVYLNEAYFIKDGRLFLRTKKLTIAEALQEFGSPCP